MRQALIGAALSLALLGAACGQSQPAKETAPEEAAPVAEATNLKDRAAQLGPAELALLVRDQVKAAPGGHGCDRIWETGDMGEVPADALTGSAFAAHAGARAYAIHCNATGEAMARDGSGQWLVFLPGDSMNAVVVACQPSPTAPNVCFKAIPRNPA
ncbi:MAG: hypothetical protein JNJ73_15825 [Hyphomonadaceae bacterium]|nr:hypothetical protein [Hyphomonadaceae bacterium]